MYYGAYKWLTIDGCYFNLKELMFMTLEGQNFKIENSVIDITNVVRVEIFQALSDCSVYLPEYSGIANNIINNNNTFTGLSTVGWGAMLHH